IAVRTATTRTKLASAPRPSYSAILGGAPSRPSRSFSRTSWRTSSTSSGEGRIRASAAATWLEWTRSNASAAPRTPVAHAQARKRSAACSPSKRGAGGFGAPREARWRTNTSGKTGSAGQARAPSSSSPWSAASSEASSAVAGSGQCWRKIGASESSIPDIQGTICVGQVGLAPLRSAPFEAANAGEQAGRRPEQAGKRRGRAVKGSGRVVKRSGRVVKRSGRVVKRSGRVAKRSGRVVKRSGRVVKRSGRVGKRRDRAVKRSGRVAKRREQAVKRSGLGGKRRDRAVKRSGLVAKRSGAAGK